MTLLTCFLDRISWSSTLSSQLQEASAIAWLAPQARFLIE